MTSIRPASKRDPDRRLFLRRTKPLHLPQPFLHTRMTRNRHADVDVLRHHESRSRSLFEQIRNFGSDDEHAGLRQHGLDGSKCVQQASAEVHRATAQYATTTSWIRASWQRSRCSISWSRSSRCDLRRRCLPEVGFRAARNGVRRIPGHRGGAAGAHAVEMADLRGLTARASLVQLAQLGAGVPVAARPSAAEPVRISC